jgi:hypothetical protein
LNPKGFSLCWNTQKRGALRAAHGQACRDLVPLGDHVLNRPVCVGKALIKDRIDLLFEFRAWRLGRQPLGLGVIDIRWRQNGIHSRQIVPVIGGNVALNYRLVLFEMFHYAFPLYKIRLAPGSACTRLERVGELCEDNL